jgi:hypothetical protein
MDVKDNDEAVLPAATERLIEQLDALRPGKQQQKAALFEKLYPAIERALAREVPHRSIMAELEKMGLRISMGGFRSLLNAERKQRDETGERVRCEHCGSNLPREGSCDALQDEA